MKTLIRLLGLLLMIILLMYLYSITFKETRSTPLYPKSKLYLAGDKTELELLLENQELKIVKIENLQRLCKSGTLKIDYNLSGLCQ